MAAGTFQHPPCPGCATAGGCRGQFWGAGANFGVQGGTNPARSCCPSQGAQGRAHPPAPTPWGGGRGGGRGDTGARSCFASAVASPGEPLLPGNAAPRGEERCWCQPGKDQACPQRGCVGGLIFVCRSQMVKEESDIISGAGAMKRGGEKVMWGIETPGASQLWGMLAPQLCFLQGSTLGCFGNHSHI